MLSRKKSGKNTWKNSLFWEKYDDDHTVIRFAADWGTTEAETNALIDIL